MKDQEGRIEILSSEAVFREERERYLEERRQLNQLPGIGPEQELWGVGFSGGGIRSATFCLGVLQSFIRQKVMKKFDYLSTVSGGGYIGSCLSSIFAGELRTGAEKDEALSLEVDGSPFVGLRATQGYETAENTRMSVQHQMHHLRSHGEYLIPRKGFAGRDFQRLLGTGVLGICYTFLVFIVALVLAASLMHLVFTAIDPELTRLSPPTTLQDYKDNCVDPCQQGIFSTWTGYITGVAKAWWTQRFVPPLIGIVASALAHPLDLFGVAVFAVIWVSCWLGFLRRKARKIAKISGVPPPGTKAGWSEAEVVQSRLHKVYCVVSLLLATAATLALGVIRSRTEGSYLGAFAIPVAFSVAAWSMAFLGMSVGETWRDMRNKGGRDASDDAARVRGREDEGQVRRSLYDAVGGANLLALVAAVVLPVLSILAFSLALLPGKFFLASVLAGVGFWVTRSQKAEKLDTSRYLGPALDVVVLLFLIILFSRVSEVLLDVHRGLDTPLGWGAAISILVAAVAMLFLGFFFDPNRISPQHFYSDRLAEAYLRTDARVKGENPDRNLPLKTIRNDEQLQLKELGHPTRAPLHLIVAAINLTNSEELVRKRMKSDHFIFSGLHVGSRATGFVRTEQYRSGRTRLATALATSAAAVSSAAGLNTRRSVAFLATLFNGRLGLWIENPAKYESDRGPTRPFTFWPHRLLQEVLGFLHERTRLVNVSDGAHTGDNLGLMPLLQRRCRLIVACDAEGDGRLDFGSLQNVVRMANVELNVSIDIDLGPVQRRKECDEGYSLSEASVVAGVITYPARRDEKGNEESGFEGRLIYIKSSVSRASCVAGLPVQAADAESCGVTAPATAPQERTLPATVASYLRAHPKEFPHQTTADQFFDDAQFEAYRALGYYSGTLAAGALGGQP